MKQGGCNSKGTFIKKSGGKKGPCSQDTFFFKKSDSYSREKIMWQGREIVLVFHHHVF